MKERDKKITVGNLFEVKTLRLKSHSGEKGFSRAITTPRIQKPGLLLTGLLEQLHPDRLQILGAAEIGYLKSLEGERLKKSLKILFKPAIPVFVVTRGIKPPEFFLSLADKKGIPVFTTTLTSSIFIERVIRFLEEGLAPTVTLHGVLVDVLGIGVFIQGKSGIGKSECALELISRGYRLVADDAVIVKRIFPSTLFGMSYDLIRYHIEVRGLGIINVKEIFGITAIREKKQMDIVVELVEWASEGVYERLGFEEEGLDILGVELPHYKIPVSPGRSVATIVEVAARNQILKIMGYTPARDFLKAHGAALLGAKKGGG